MTQREYLFTSESVTEGHPDKMCDAISDAVLDAILTREIELADQGFPGASPDYVRCACECFTTTGLIVVGGEIRTHGYVEIPKIVREVVKEIGYTRAKFGFDAETCGVVLGIHEQSADIAQGVDESFEVQHGQGTDPLDSVGAGDQGMMFGYACTETSQLMPMPIYLAHRLAERLTAVRKAEVLDYLRPDGKTQVSVRYIDDKPVAVEKILISTQHADGVDIEGLLRPDLIEHVIKPVFELEGLEYKDAEIFINPTGRFVIGGPMGDTGLTGRKIIVDTYGGMGRHGGGAFSGKDCTKVDRSAAYAARWVAKNVCAVLGYAHVGHAVERHGKHAIIFKSPDSGHLELGPRGVLIISESDLYRLIMKSQDWVVYDVVIEGVSLPNCSHVHKVWEYACPG